MTNNNYYIFPYLITTPPTLPLQTKSYFVISLFYFRNEGQIFPVSVWAAISSGKQWIELRYGFCLGWSVIC